LISNQVNYQITRSYVGTAILENRKITMDLQMVINYYPAPVIAWGQNNNPLSFRPAQDITQRISSQLTKVDQVSTMYAYQFVTIAIEIEYCNHCI
jgi:hypothetical protein